MKYIVLALLVTSWAILGLVGGENNHVQMFNGKMGDSIDFKCTPIVSLNSPNAQYTVLYWTVPNDFTYFENPRNITPGGRWNFFQLSADGKQATIEELGVEHEGVFECHVRQGDINDTVYMTKLHVQTTPLTEIYRMNIIIGVVAAVVALFIIMSVYIVYMCRWETRHGRMDTKPMLDEDDRPASNGRDGEVSEKTRYGFSNQGAAVDVENPTYDREMDVLQDTKM